MRVGCLVGVTLLLWLMTPIRLIVWSILGEVLFLRYLPESHYEKQLALVATQISQHLKLRCCSQLN